MPEQGQPIVPFSSSAKQLTVLIFTSRLGGGHEASGRAIQAELEERGHRAVVVDGLHAMHPVLDKSFRWAHARQLDHAAWSYETSFRLYCRRSVWAMAGAFGDLFTARGLLALVASIQPDIIVSTYPLVTAVLGRLRGSGRLQIPVAAVISDYGVHRLWVAPAVDLHLVPSRVSAALAKRFGARTGVVRLPVAPDFRAVVSRGEARAALGLPPEKFIALIVGGAWGIGDLEGAARCAAESGAFTVVVTGRNAELKTRLEQQFAIAEDVRVLGWTQSMALLMRAADCLIQNAGGMTCLEAVEAGLPILIFNPIPGHGVLNARVMEQAGAARWVRTKQELQDLLQSASRGDSGLPIPRREPDAPSLTTLLAPILAAPPPSRARRALRRPVLAGALALALMASATLGAEHHEMRTAFTTVEQRVDHSQDELRHIASYAHDPRDLYHHISRHLP